MATDIIKSINANPIKNGTVVVTTSTTGKYSKNDNYVKNTPVIADIESKFDSFFDDRGYYFTAPS